VLSLVRDEARKSLAEERVVGYSPADSGPDWRIDVELLQASVLLQQHMLGKAYFSLYNYTLALENHIRLAREYIMRSLAIYEMRHKRASRADLDTY
jgi:hypothetical protein